MHPLYVSTEIVTVWHLHEGIGLGFGGVVIRPLAFHL